MITHEATRELKTHPLWYVPPPSSLQLLPLCQSQNSFSSFNQFPDICNLNIQLGSFLADMLCA